MIDDKNIHKSTKLTNALSIQKVIDEDIHGPTKKQQCNEEMLESGVHTGGTLELLRVVRTGM
jgi:hypothetical protein